MWRLLFIPFILFSIASSSLKNVVHAENLTTQVVVNEIQTGGFDELLHEDGNREFIELHNLTGDNVDISGWRLQYFSSTREDVFDVSASPTRELFSLDGLLSSNGFVLFSYEGFIANADGYFGQGSTATSGLLARSGGHVRLINAHGSIVDLVGWGTAKSPETKAIPEIKPDYSAERKIIDGVTVDTGDNFNDFVSLENPTPQGGSLLEPILEPEVEPIIPPCDGAVISELLPNPDGIDAGHEFIELYNPTDTDIFLEDCILKSIGSTNSYIFEIGSVLEPKEYKAFYDGVTGLTLANAAGGEIVLEGTNSDYSVQYPENMEINHSWSLIDDLWHDSTQPTPNALNILPVPVVLSVEDEEEALQPCSEGKYRSAETNRCRNLPVLSAAIAACGVNQVRSPDTNRCRSIASLASSLIPCREGQERSPETNRCRNTNTSVQTACQEGYERNQETGRCRKTPAVLGASASVGGMRDQPAEGSNYLFLTFMTVLVFGYGIYEYRRDFSNLIARIKAKRALKPST